MLKQIILEKLPLWYKKLNPDKHYLVLTNDMDSYYSCKYLRAHFKLQVGGFYCFNSGLYLNKERTEGKQPIYVDLSISEGMTFDNHYSFIKNPLAINPNINISKYNNRFNGSIYALIYSLYSEDFSKLSESQLTALLCIDGWYVGYYNKGGIYKDINIYWYEALGYKDYFLPILEKHDIQYFFHFICCNLLKEQIYINNEGYLYNRKNITLPKVKFELVEPIEKKYVEKNEALSIHNKGNKKIFVSAETYYNKYVINLRRKAR